MSSGGAGSRVSIPNNVRQTIQHLREITGKQHTDEDIYTVLKECSMDPNETTQKLLFLDTFHVVERKPRRKEISNSKAPEDFRLSSNTQGRGARAVRGNYSSQYNSSDAGAGRSSAARRANGVGNRTERGTLSSSVILQKPKNNAAPHLTKPTSEIPNGLRKLSNGSSDPARASPSGGGVIDVLKDGPCDENKDTETPVHSNAAEQLPSNDIPTFASVIGVDLPNSATSSDPPAGSPPTAPAIYSSASDPVLVPTLNSRLPSAVGSQWIVSEPNNPVDKHLSHSVADLDLPKGENVPLGTINKKIPSKLNAEVKGKVSEPSQSSSLATHDGLAAVKSSSIYAGQSPQGPIAPLTAMAESEAAPANAESSSQSITDSNVSVGQHVTFPNHFQVPEALRSGLTFGSFGPIMKSNGPAGDDSNSKLIVESSQESDDTAEKHSSSQSVTSIGHEVDYPDQPRPKPCALEKGSSEGNVASGVLPQHEQVKQETLLHSEGPQNLVIQNAANYSLGLMPGSQFEAPEPQPRDVPPLPNFVGGNSAAISSPSPSSTPPVNQTAAMAQNSIPMSPHPFPLFRQPYPPNYFPYGPYFSPFFVPQMHPFLGPNGFPQQPSAGNAYLPPAAATGVKYSVPQFKAGPNPGNPALIGLPPGYGSYSSSHVGYGPSPVVSSGSSTGGEDIAASQLKENHIYTTAGQLSEGSTIWFPGPGQDISRLPVSSLYNLPLQGQHVAYSPVQSYPGIYQPPQTIAAPSAALPQMLQQPQATAGGVKTTIPSEAGVYQQQAQHAQIQMNWSR